MSEGLRALLSFHEPLSVLVSLRWNLELCDGVHKHDRYGWRIEVKGYERHPIRQPIPSIRAGITCSTRIQNSFSPQRISA
jgi:hypothetical protein